MSEELGLEKLPRKACAVQVNECLIGPWAVVVKPPGKDAFSGACLSLDQDRALCLSDLACVFGKLANNRARPEERIHDITFLTRLAHELLSAISLVFDQPPKDHQQGRELDGFGQEVVR